MAGGSDSSDSDGLYNEWKNKLLRESIALSSLIRIRDIKSSTFFTKGRLTILGEHIKENQADCIFVNYPLSVIQKRNLEMYIIMFLNVDTSTII